MDETDDDDISEDRDDADVRDIERDEARPVRCDVRRSGRRKERTRKTRRKY